MSSGAQLEAEISIGRGVFLKKIINPVFFKISKNPLKNKNCITKKTYIPNFKLIAQKMSELLYLKDDPIFA